MNLQQELTDRLVVAAEEQDVLFTLFWLNEMNKVDLLPQCITTRHSTLNCSAIESTVRNSYSKLRKVIIQILLLTLGTGYSITKFLDYAIECRNREMVELLKGWKTADLEQMSTACKLVSLPLAQAGDVIDQTLPEPPNASQLTGYNPLPDPASFAPSVPAPVSVPTNPVVDPTPPRPASPPVVIESEPLRVFTPPRVERESTAPRPRSERKPSASSSSAAVVVPPPSSVVRPRSPSPARRRSISRERSSTTAPTTRRHRRDSLPPQEDLPFRRPSTSRNSNEGGSGRSKSTTRPQLSSPPPRDNRSSRGGGAAVGPLDTSLPLARVNVARFPVGWNGFDLERMFSDIGVSSKTILCHSTYWPTYAFLDVDREDANRCIRLLEGTLQGDARIRCNFAGRQGNNHYGGFRDRLPPPPPTTARNIGGDDSSSSVGGGARPQVPIRPPRSPSSMTDDYNNNKKKQNVMIVNLPYHETDEARIIVSKLRYFDLIRLSDRQQSIAWFPETSPSRSDHLIKLWHDYFVDGKRLKVIVVKDGLNKEEAIRDYFQRQDSTNSISGSSSSKRHHSRPPLSRSGSRSRGSEHSRSSRRRSRSPTPSTSTRVNGDDHSRKSSSSASHSHSHKRSKRSTSQHRSSRLTSDNHNEDADAASSSYGPSPPPPDSSIKTSTSNNNLVVTTNGSNAGSSKEKERDSREGRGARSRSGSTTTTSHKYHSISGVGTSLSSSSRRSHHHHHRSDRERERDRYRERERERDRERRGSRSRD